MLRTRFAPSPTGAMHVGNLRTALFSYLAAKSQNGKLVLRIEDTDRERYVEGAEALIYRTLSEVGIVHDEGPDVGGPYAPYVQSARKEQYLPYAKQLIEKGQAYYCFCSKERLASLHETGTFGGYDRHCRDLPQEEVTRLLQSGAPYVIRQRTPLTGATKFQDAVFGEISIDNAEIEDQVLIKEDGYPTYNFANVVDDHLMKINCVVRGCEYLTSTPKYNLLYEAFGWEIPSYIHLPLIMGRDEDGTVSKLSKRHGSTSFAGLVEEGYLPEAITNYIALLGWSPKDNQELFDMQGLISAFTVEGVSKSPATFDYEKLSWMNGEYIKNMDAATFDAHAAPFYEVVFGQAEKDWDVLRAILQARILKFQDIPKLLHFFVDLPAYDRELFINKKSKTTLENVPDMLKAAIPVLQEITEWTLENIHDALIALAGAQGVKNGTLLWPVRIAAAGVAVTPGGAMEILQLLGKEEALRRLQQGLEKAEGT